MEKITIKTISIKGDWINLLDDKDRAITIFTGEKEGKKVNPVLKEKLASTKEGEIVELGVVESKGKFYGNDPKIAGAKFVVTKDKGLEIASMALQASVTLYSLSKDVEIDRVLATSDKFIEYLKSKSTK